MSICADHTEPATTFRFTKADKLLQRAEFISLSKCGKKIQNSYFIAYVAEGKTDRSRLGITVTKKVGHAVTRNRFKRHLREYFRQHRQTLYRAWDINIIVKRQAGTISNETLLLFLEELFERIKAVHHH